jgi:hypothetical protein
MAVAIVGPSDFKQVVLEIGAAELPPRRGVDAHYDGLLTDEQFDRLNREGLTAWTESDLEAVSAAAVARRGQYFGRLEWLCSDWYSGRLRAVDVGGVRTIDTTEFTSIAPSRRVSELTAALDEGKHTEGRHFSDRYRALRPNFDPTKMVGRPMLVAERPEGPYVEFEGLHRLCWLESSRVDGELRISEVDVLLGVGEFVRDWQPFFGTPGRS